MEPSSTHHAWLYQFKPSKDAAWLKQLRDTRRIEWQIIRWVGETKVGDLILFWESGEEGGLRGWGRVSAEPYAQTAIAGRKARWQVPIEVSGWLGRTIPRKAVVDARAFIAQNLFLSVSQGANFPLEPDEVTKLLNLMPSDAVRPDNLSGIERHPPSVPSALNRSADAPPPTDEPDEAFSGVRDESIDEGPNGTSFFSTLSRLLGFRLTSAAGDILRAADYRPLGIQGPISTTRLFLAAFQSNRRVSVSAREKGESVAIEILSEVSNQIAGQLARVEKDYRGEQKKGLSTDPLRVTENVVNLIERAWALCITSSPNSTELSADFIVASLLTFQDGKVVERLERVGLSLLDIQIRVLRVVEDRYPALLEFWQVAFQVRDSAVAVSPLTGGMPVAVVGNDNALKRGVKDSLGADREAQAFAGLTLSKHFVPPLAVGVFGEWGSGKSFFMKLVYEHIERLSNEAGMANGPQELLNHVVQIRFNAWHYVDTNLWASLVDHIFTELDRSTNKEKREASEVLFEQLSTARELTIESAERLIQRRKEQAGAAKSVAEAERKLLQKQSSIGTSSQVYWEAVKSQFLGQLDEKENKSLRNAADRLAIPGLIEDGKVLNEAIEQLEEQRGRANLLAVGLRSQLGSWVNVGLFLGVFLLIGVVLYYLRKAAATYLDEVIVKDLLTPAAMTTSSVIAAIASVFAKTTSQVKGALNSLQSFRAKFSKAAEAALATPTDDVKAKQQELARLTAEVEEGRARLAASTERLGEAARDYNAGTGKGRLLNFVRSRAANKDYAKHLGLVATIRKDFEELSDLIATASTPKTYRSEPELVRDREAYADRVEKLLELAKPENGGLLTEAEREKLSASKEIKAPSSAVGLNRIVLYVDDLDRCKPEKVAEVLQAVHLLLSFRLFVVFVAVDVRWVSRALRTNYPTLLSKASDTGSASGATAHDYLEKIFQIPYWVRPMTDQSSEDFMTDRLTGQQTSLAEMLKSLEETRTNVEPNRENDGSGNAADFTINEADGTTSDAKAAEDVTDTPGQRQTIPHVDLNPEEVKFMTELARWAGNSPRRLLRFMNVYQVIKASLSVEDAAANSRGGSYELIAQVAIATAIPHTFDDWLKVLQQEAPSETISAALKRWREGSSADQRVLETHLDSILDVLARRRPETKVGNVKRAALLTKRFSFGAEPIDLGPGVPQQS